MPHSQNEPKTTPPTLTGLTMSSGQETKSVVRALTGTRAGRLRNLQADLGEDESLKRIIDRFMFV